jgi:hypothetical protein
MRELNDEERRALWKNYQKYRWEITRRNKEYQDDYDKLQKTHDPAAHHKIRMTMAKKWGFALDPYAQIDNFLEDIDAFPGNLNVIKSPFTGYLIDEGLMHILGNPKEDGSMDHELVISIDLKWPDWLTIASIESLLNSIRQYSPLDIKQKRISWDMLDIYLRVFDMHKDGISIDTIAKEVYPNDYKKANIEGTMSSLIKKVQRNLERATKMIHSGHISWQLNCPWQLIYLDLS